MIKEKTVFSIELLFNANRGDALVIGGILKERFCGVSVWHNGIDGFWMVRSGNCGSRETALMVEDEIKDTISRTGGCIISD